MFQKRSLRYKISFFISLFTLLITGTLGTVMYLLAQKYLKEEVMNRGQIIVRRLAESHAYQISLSLADELQPILQRMVATEKGIEYVEIVDQNGKIVQTADGAYRAQTDPTKRPADYASFDFDQVKRYAMKEGREIKGAAGQKLYDFYCPVTLITERRSSESVGLSMVGEQPGTKEHRVIGAVRIAMLPTTLDQAREELFVAWIAIMASAVLVGLVAAYLLGAITTMPVKKVAEAASMIAGGDLNQHVPSASNDELGILAQSFNAMAENLAKLIRRIRDAYSRVDQGREQIRNSTLQVLEASRTQASSIADISSAMTEMNSSLKEVAESTENLSTSSEQTSSSILEMAGSIVEVSNHMKSLANSVDETATSITEMVSSIQQVDKSVELLSDLVADTAVSIKEMESSIGQVEKSTGSSQRLSQQVSSSAEQGMKSVALTLEGMGRIREAVKRASEVVSQLGTSSEEIGKILNVIDDIAEQTNLLALNAAIIAAQAGEHGKGFAVVAEEIRELAERTASSTKEIDTLIKTVQRDVSNAVQTMTGGYETVEEGFRMSVQANESLKGILVSARTSADMAKEIARASMEQSKGIQSINRAIEQIREMMFQISKATAEQKSGSEQIISAVENMRQLTVFVNRATSEQSKGSKQITMAVESVMELVNHIMKATAEQARGSEQIIKVVEFFKETNVKNMESVAAMDRALSILLEQTGILKQEISIFKV